MNSENESQKKYIYAIRRQNCFAVSQLRSVTRRLKTSSKDLVSVGVNTPEPSGHDREKLLILTTYFYECKQPPVSQSTRILFTEELSRIKLNRTWTVWIQR